MYLGGNGFYWRTAFHDGAAGRDRGAPRRDGTRTWEADPGENCISASPASRAGCGAAAAAPRSAWSVSVSLPKASMPIPTSCRTPASFDPRARSSSRASGRRRRIGDFGSLGGAAGLELDIADPTLGTPPHALILARSVEHSNVYAVDAGGADLGPARAPTASRIPRSAPTCASSRRQGRCRLLHRLHRLGVGPGPQRLRQQCRAHHRQCAEALPRPDADRVGAILLLSSARAGSEGTVESSGPQGPAHRGNRRKRSQCDY